MRLSFEFDLLSRLRRNKGKDTAEKRSQTVNITDPFPTIIIFVCIATFTSNCYGHSGKFHLSETLSKGRDMTLAVPDESFRFLMTLNRE